MEEKDNRNRNTGKAKLKSIAPFIFLIILYSNFAVITAQVEIRESPSAGYRSRLRNLIDTMRVIDTHEHLFNPDLLKRSSLLDFMLLFQMHNFNDFVSAGLNPDYMLPLMSDTLTPVQKWKIIEPFWEKSANTGFNRVSLLAADKLFGIENLNDKTVEPLSDKIRRSYEADWFNSVMRYKCRIAYIIQDGELLGDKYNDRVKYVKRFTEWLSIDKKFTVDSISVYSLSEIKTLEEFTASLEKAFRDAMKKGMIAVKVTTAYRRTLLFEEVKEEQARKVFRHLMEREEDSEMPFEDVKPLQDYMMFRLMDLAKQYGLPVVIHAGLQEGNGNYISNSDPTLLANIFFSYPEVRFSIFHGAYPFGGQLATLAKNFPNVYIDMCWLYAISPTYAERYLNEWIETVPSGKIMAFGGDYNNIENSYAELLIARQIITRVLTFKVGGRYMTEERAAKVARLILYENAREFYSLK